jgi:methionyl aminopeptidase
VASAARVAGARLIVAGAPLRDVCEQVEHEITRRGGGLAFPVQSSRNEIAAHYCASPEDATVYVEGDLAKLDLGVHVDGWVVDTALTVNVGDRPENRPFVDAARAALESAIATAGPGVAIRRVSEAIEATLRRYGMRPMQNLCGHGVARWTVHCPPAIPNAADGTSDRLLPDAVVAVEPFATDGKGEVVERGNAEVFRLDPGGPRALWALPRSSRPCAASTACPSRGASSPSFRGRRWKRRCARYAGPGISGSIRRWWRPSSARSRRRSTRSISDPMEWRS